MNKRHSFKDHTGKSMLGMAMNGIVKGSCFSQLQPDTQVFHRDSTATFVNCNLDNCIIPAGCIVQGGTNKRYKPQIDGCDWEVDADNNPTVCFDREMRARDGLNTDPTKIERLEYGVTNR